MFHFICAEKLIWRLRFKGAECDLWGPSCLSLVHVKMYPILWDSVLLLSYLHIIRIYNGDSLKSSWKTPSCSPFSVVSRVCEMLWNAKEVLAPSMMLSTRPASLSCPCLFSEASYSQSNGASYLCNGSPEKKTPLSLEK